VLAGLIAGYGGWRLSGIRPATRRIPAYGRAPAFTLTNQLGEKVDSSAFAGKVQIVTFLFPYCTDYCPLIAQQLVKIEKALRRAGLADRVQLVSFNVDPQDTGPATLRAFMKEYGWNPENRQWQYLTGRPELIRRIVTGGYHVGYQKVSLASEAKERNIEKQKGIYTPEPHAANPLARRANPDYDVQHNDEMVLVDSRGRIRAVIINSYAISPARILPVIRQLLENPSNHGIRTRQKEAVEHP